MDIQRTVFKVFSLICFHLRIHLCGYWYNHCEGPIDPSARKVSSCAFVIDPPRLTRLCLSPHQAPLCLLLLQCAFPTSPYIEPNSVTGGFWWFLYPRNNCEPCPWCCLSQWLRSFCGWRLCHGSGRAHAPACHSSAGTEPHSELSALAHKKAFLSFSFTHSHYFRQLEILIGLFYLKKIK